MGLKTLIAGDGAIVDDVEYVTLLCGDTEVENARASRHELDIADMAAAGALMLNNETLVWRVQRPTMDGNVLKAGDTITDADDIVWKIIHPKLHDEISCWHCLCTKGRS
jgi:hypothetical protein